MRQRDGRQAFSLIELLITIGIITILLAILLPIISRVQAASRTTVCLANLQQWGAAFHIYLSENRGQMPVVPDGNDPHHENWWQFLSSSDGKMKLTLLCPEAPPTGTRATPKKRGIDGSAHVAWELRRDLWGRTYGSYGMNLWMYSKRPGYKNPYGAARLPQAAEVPLLGDSWSYLSAPVDSDGIPPSLEGPTPKSTGNLHLADFCIDRHNMAVNIVFVDGHAETVPLAGLWKLRWSEKFKPRDVAIVSP